MTSARLHVLALSLGGPMQPRGQDKGNGNDRSVDRRPIECGPSPLGPDCLAATVGVDGASWQQRAVPPLRLKFASVDVSWVVVWVEVLITRPKL